MGVDVKGFNPDVLGVYASQDARGKKSVVVLNKNPRNATALSLSGLPSGDYFFRHFGGGAGVAKWQVSYNHSHGIVSSDYDCSPPRGCKATTLSYPPTRLYSFSRSNDRPILIYTQCMLWIPKRLLLCYRNAYILESFDLGVCAPIFVVKAIPL